MHSLHLRTRNSLLSFSLFTIASALLLVLSGCASVSSNGGGGGKTAVSITTASLPNGTVGAAYNTALAASGGTGTYTWSIASGTLPAGLKFDGTTGTISGTPTAAATASLNFQVSDNGNTTSTAAKSLTLTVVAPPALTITTPSLPNGTVSLAYTATLAATGGNAPYTWSLAPGATLPAGLSLSSAGAISGTPTAAVTSSVMFQVADSSGPKALTATKTLSIVINPAPPTLVITTTALPAGTVGAAYTATLAASGGTPPYAWSITSGTLPSGLALDKATGIISGKPAAAVAAQVTFQVADSGKQTATKAFTITIVPAGSPLSVSTTVLPAGTVGSPYTATLAATGGTPPYSWTSTALPAGLTLNAATGAITGTPTVAANAAAVTATVKDSAPPPATASANLTLTITPTLAITTTALPNGTTNTPYTATLAATGGTGPYTWTLINGTLPAGLMLAGNTGAISGTPTVGANATPLTFQVKDSLGATATATLNLTINVPLSVTTVSPLPGGTVGAAYTATLAATGGTPPYTWTLAPGNTLPAGLNVSAAGLITGTPTAPGVSSVTFQVKDSAAPPATANSTVLSLTISPATLVITTTTLPNGMVGAAYSANLAATGGTTPYTWALAPGNTLPAGLNLSAAGAITGTPTATANATPVTFTLTDKSVPPKTQNVTIPLTITAAALTITTTTLPNGTVGTAYNATLAATGGTPPYVWSSTPLPAGLNLNPNTGAITGTPTAAANAASVTFTVKDSATPQGSAPKALTITITPTLAVTTAALPAGTVGTAYTATLAATGGAGPYTWTLINGTFPAGLGLNAATGAIAGTPTAAGAPALTFQVKDSTGATANSAPLTLTVNVAPLSITTTTLPNGMLGAAYNATLAATGGVTPYTWTLAPGSNLPAGLNLSAAGVINGTPTATASGPITFTVTDASVPPNTKNATLTLTVTAGNFTVSVTPARASLTAGQTLTVTATTNDTAGVNWTATGGNFSSGSTLTGVANTFTAPNTAGTYTITATSVSNATVTDTTTVYVTNLSGVYTYHNDLARDGVNSQEYALNTSNVNTTSFGKLFSCQADGAIYAQPLWVANVNISGGTHNVVVAATMRDSVYVFDADASPCVTYWHKTLIPGGETYGSSGDLGSADIYPDIGILGTPVIDPGTNRIYLITKTKTTGGTYHQRLHVLNLADGSEPVAAVDLSGVTYQNSSGGTVSFSALKENQRPGLALSNGVVYASWASHGDQQPYHGWIVGFSASTLAQVAVFNTSPDGREGGIWMSGGAPAFDTSGNMYVITGNGDYNGTTDFGDSLLKLSTNGGLSVPCSTSNQPAGTCWFTPYNQSILDASDYDFGAGAAVVLIDLPSGAPVQRLVIGGGKGNGFVGEMYVLNRDDLGGYTGPNGPDNAIQEFSFGQPIFATPAYWQNRIYLAGAGGALKAFSVSNTAAPPVTTTPVFQSGNNFNFPGATPSISAQGGSNGIAWAIDSSNYGTHDSGSRTATAAILHAYNANALGTELWNSTMAGGDAAGNAVKFTVPTVANGHVYVGTRGNDTTTGSGNVLGEIDVYGLKPN